MWNSRSPRPQFIVTCRPTLPWFHPIEIHLSINVQFELRVILVGSTNKPIICSKMGLFTFPLCSFPAINEARSDEVDVTIALCEAKPICTHGYRDRSGRVNFRIQKDSSVALIQCSHSGECVIIQPAGKREPVTNVTVFFSNL